MYDWPETRLALDRFWSNVSSALRDAGIAAPPELTRSPDLMASWLSPDLLIGQTCGWPFANILKSHVHLFGCFDHGLVGCPPGTYNSLFIGRSPEAEKYIKESDGIRSVESVAVNLTESQSGFHVFTEISGLPAEETVPPAHRVMTGSHLGSIEAVAKGAASIAAIDAVSFRLAERFRPEITKQVHILGKSKPKPALPLITANSNKEKTGDFLSTLSVAIDQLTIEDRDQLFIQSVLPRHADEYALFENSAR